MKRFFLLACLPLYLPLAALAASAVPANAVTSTVLIANYSNSNKFLGWGSGFFVDDDIIVTNRHVIEEGDWYRIYATNADESLNYDCYNKTPKGDIRLNLDDDVAYIRATVPCSHSVMDFEEDPQRGDPVSVIGYPYSGSGTVGMSITSGKVGGYSEEGWLETDAFMDFGNSGGPVVDGDKVLGVAVAKGVDDQGNYVTSYFIPSSVIIKGLLAANDADFGYVPREVSSRSSRGSSSVSSSSSQVVLSSSSSSRSSSSSSRMSSSSSRSAVPAFPDVPATRTGYAAILALRDLGILAGYPDGTFRPDAGVNRAEFLKILVSGFRAGEVRGETGCFTDVRDQWFAPYVCAAKRLGWVSGYPDGTFRPTQTVNRAEAMKITVTAFGAQPVAPDMRMPRDARSGTWFSPYVAAGIRMGIVDPFSLFRPARDLTREEAAIWIDGARR